VGSRLFLHPAIFVAAFVQLTFGLRAAPFLGALVP
jgi:hypothetical protein